MQTITPSGPDDRLIDQKTLVKEWLNNAVSSRTVDREVQRGKFPPPTYIGIKKFWWESIVRNHMQQKQARAYRRQAAKISEAQ
jgi:hypothetical protein